MTCSSEFLRFFPCNISPVLPCRRQICWCSGMFSCVNGAARGPQGQLAMLWCVFLSRGFSHRQDMEKQLWQVIFFQHVHMDKLWQVDCCLKKDLIDYGRVAMRDWTFECSQRKLGSTNRSTACEDWWKDHRLPELIYPYAGNMPEIHGNSLTVKICRHCLKLSAELLPFCYQKLPEFCDQFWGFHLPHWLCCDHRPR